MDIRAPEQQYNPYRIFSREQWAGLRDDTPMTLEAHEIAKLHSMHDRLDLREVEEIYLPLSRLLSIYVDPGFITGSLHRNGGFVFFGLALAMEGALCWFLQRTEPGPRASYH